MYLLDIIPATKIPHTQQQVFSYFSSQKLPPGALVQIPLGRRQETGVVFDAHEITDHKMEIKRADFELRNVSRIVSAEPILTKQQLDLALWLGQYYFASPGLFVKMMLPKKLVASRQSLVAKTKQKLILAPTIAQVANIATNHPNATLWHSGLKPKEQNKIWWQIKNGETQTIIGTRSAVFLPFTNLREIIIEDEQSSNHKSWDMFPHYDSRLVAQKLAGLFNSQMSFPRKRESRSWIPGQARDDKFHLIDMRQEIKDGNFSIFSRALQSAIKNALAQKQQIVLFINRRGAANFILCRDCGYVAKCQNCDAPLAHHLINGRPTLLCHHCGAKDAPPSLCPNCQGSRVKTVGSGTQKVEAETVKLYPSVKIVRLDSDIAPQPKDQQKIIDAFVKKDFDILITTQIIFSWLPEIKKAAPSVAAVLSADTLLHLPDFRSGERTWQTITTLQQLLYCHPEYSEGSRGIRQRAEIRATEPLDSSPTAQNDKQKTFLIQTYNPENSIMKYIAQNDWAGFNKEEMETRQALNYPPFSQIVKLTFRHRDGKKAGQEAKILAAKLKNVIASPAVAEQNNSKYSKNNAPRPATAGLPPLKLRGGEGELLQNIEISPALPAFIPRERGKFIWNIILKFTNSPSLFKGRLGGIFTNPDFLRRRNSLLQYVPQNCEIDIDPENLL